LCERILARQAPVGDRELAPATNAELLTKNVAMRLDRPGGDAEPLRDLVVRAARGDENDHVPLPIGDRWNPLNCCVHHGCQSTTGPFVAPFTVGRNPGRNALSLASQR
jgi:hypothetical protein